MIPDWLIDHCEERRCEATIAAGAKLEMHEEKNKVFKFIIPPWQQKIFSSMIATIGRQLKQSVNVFHSLIL